MGQLADIVYFVFQEARDEMAIGKHGSRTLGPLNQPPKADQKFKLSFLVFHTLTLSAKCSVTKIANTRVQVATGAPGTVWG